MHTSANISFLFCDIIHYTQLAPFWSQKGNTVKNQKTMKMKLKQREKSLIWKHEDDIFEKYWSVTYQFKDFCKE